MTTMETPAYKKLVKLAKRLGGQVLPIPAERWKGGLYSQFPTDLGSRGWLTAPFCKSIGVYWSEKLIVHQLAGFSNAGLIHEMGHTFASKHPPNSKHVEEVDFLGWELELAKSLGVRPAWLREMASYGVNIDDDGINSFCTISELSRKGRDKVFAEARATAIKLGSLGPKGEIRTVRS